MKTVRAQLPHQVRNRIAELMKDLDTNDRLPGEAALAETLSVSRATIRDALTHLERDGLVIRRHGLGTFVAPRSAQLGTVLNEVKPIPDVIAASGYVAEIGALEVGRTVPPGEVRRQLGSGDDEPLPAIEILFLADGNPAIYVVYYLRRDFPLDAIDWRAFDGRMVDLAEASLDSRVHQTHARISARPAGPEVAEKLGVAQGHPLMCFTTAALLVDGRIAYCSRSYQDSRVLEVRVVRNRSVRSADRPAEQQS